MVRIVDRPTLSVGIPVWNGEMFLAQTIESLLAQDYESIEIIILDNMSTDRTSEICKQYAKKDARVKYILDESQRDVMQAHKVIARMANTEFFMVACDDDWYAPRYVSTLMSLMLSNPSVGLAYSGLGWIGSDGSKKESGFNRFLTRRNSKFNNFASYLFWRNPLPIVFGIVRTEIHKDALNYFYRPDNRGWDHDNLYMLRLLSMTHVDSVKEVLFYYRQQDRDVLYKKRGQYYQPQKAFNKVVNHVSHQISLTCAVAKIIDASHFSSAQKIILRAYSYVVLLFNCGPRYFVAYCWKSAVLRKLRVHMLVEHNR